MLGMWAQLARLHHSMAALGEEQCLSMALLSFGTTDRRRLYLMLS